jgi:putative ABC transport system permease protein
MPNHFLKTTARRLLLRKSYSCIHILGLSTGIAACLLIYGYVHNELTYDAYHPGADRIVRVTTTLHAPESDMSFATSPIPLAGALQRDFPDIRATVRIEQADGCYPPASPSLMGQRSSSWSCFSPRQACWPVFTRPLFYPVSTP